MLNVFQAMNETAAAPLEEIACEASRKMIQATFNDCVASLGLEHDETATKVLGHAFFVLFLMGRMSAAN